MKYDQFGVKVAQADVDPVYIRLPQEGELCPHFGLSRSAYYGLIREGLIVSRCLCSRGASRGVRLVDYASVRQFLDSLPRDDSRRGTTRTLYTGGPRSHA